MPDLNEEGEDLPANLTCGTCEFRGPHQMARCRHYESPRFGEFINDDDDACLFWE